MKVVERFKSEVIVLFFDALFFGWIYPNTL